MTLTHPIAAAIALLLAAWIIFALRRIDRIAWCLVAAGAVCLTAAAAGVTIHGSRPARAVVMIDQSASTRTAEYHEAERLHQRLKALLPDESPPIIEFSDGSAPETIWQPADAEVILLFSDGQFTPPTMLPPTWVILDPALKSPPDASITTARRDAAGDAVVAVKNAGVPRELTVGNHRQPIAVDGGILTVKHPEGDVAFISPGDPWPENDTLRISLPRSESLSRWWIGPDPPAGWLGTQLPDNLAAFANAAVVAIRGDVNLSRTQVDHLRRYVNDLGGGILLVDSRVLPELSPLSFDAPTPQRRWLVLIDRSGSMATPLGDSTRFAATCQAGRALLKRLPSQDRVAIGGVAHDLNWWIPDASVADARSAVWPPANQTPSGPTNIEPLLHQLLTRDQNDLSAQIILMTDSDAPIDQTQKLIDAFATHHATLHLLSIDANNSALANVALASGGEALTSGSSIELMHHAENLADQSQPRIASAELTFESPLNLPPRRINDLQSTWLRADARALAQSTSAAVLAADWQRGSGKVLACSFTPISDEANAFSNIIAGPPRDPRFQVVVNDGRQLAIEAREQDRHLNELRLAVSIDGQAQLPLKQLAPGRYAAAFSTASDSRVATIFLDDVAIAREVIPARYAPEFDAIGNNESTLKLIAERSGGGIVEAEQIAPIRLPQIQRTISLAAPLAATASACWLAALWRRKL